MIASIQKYKEMDNKTTEGKVRTTLVSFNLLMR